MAATKFAISVPEEIMDEVDRAARARGVTRSRFISDILKLAAQAQRDDDIRRRLDALFADDRAADEQRETAEAFTRARPGSKW